MTTDPTRLRARRRRGRASGGRSSIRERASSTKSDSELAPDSTACLPDSTTLFNEVDISTHFRSAAAVLGLANAAAHLVMVYPVSQRFNPCRLGSKNIVARTGLVLRRPFCQRYAAVREFVAVDNRAKNVGRELVGFDVDLA
jgi:hypothetical protein